MRMRTGVSCWIASQGRWSLRLRDAGLGLVFCTIGYATSPVGTGFVDSQSRGQVPVATFLV